MKVSAFPQAFDEFERASLVHRNNKHSNVAMKDFEHNYNQVGNNAVIPPGVSDTGKRLHGKFCMCVSLEK